MGLYRCLLLTLGGAPNNFSFLIRALLNQINDTSILYNVIMGILNILRYLKFHGQVQTDLLHNGCKGKGFKMSTKVFWAQQKKKIFFFNIVVYSHRWYLNLNTVQWTAAHDFLLAKVSPLYLMMTSQLHQYEVATVYHCKGIKLKQYLRDLL